MEVAKDNLSKFYLINNISGLIDRFQFDTVSHNTTRYKSKPNTSLVFQSETDRALYFNRYNPLKLVTVGSVCIGLLISTQPYS